MSTKETFIENQKITPYVWLIAFIVMLPTSMVAIGTSSANVALNYIGGSLSVSLDDSTWILTSYLIANAIILPVTSWLCNVFGRKKFIIISICIFTLGSLLCGLSTTLPMIIIARIIQGLGGGAMMPIAQAVLIENFPQSKRGLAMAIFGIGMMAAPVIGPSLGGWITDNYSWNWIFFINVPLGIISAFLSYFFIKDDEDKSAKKTNSTDYVGITALIIWIVTMQLVLDQGQKSDWFQAPWVCWVTFASVAFFVFLIVWELKYKNAIIDLNVFKDMNYSIGCIVSGVMTGILYGTIALLPLFLETLLQYNASLSGEVLMSRGISCILVTVLIGLIADKVNMKFVIAIGFIIWGISFLMFGGLNLDVSNDSLIPPNLVCGIGQGLIYTLLTTITFSTLSKNQVQNATGLYNLIRNLGGSIGVSAMKTMLANNAQINQVYLVAHLYPTNPVYQQALAKMISFFNMHMNIVSATHKATGYIYNLLIQQATLLSYMDLFKLYALISFILASSILLFRTIKI